MCVEETKRNMVAKKKEVESSAKHQRKAKSD